MSTTSMTRLISRINPAMSWRSFCLSAGSCLALFFVTSANLLAQSENSKTSKYVKIHAVANKPNAAGHQMITLTIKINDKYYLIGNTVPAYLAEARFSVNFSVSGKPADAEITYPPGQLVKEKGSDDYSKYEGKIVVTALLRRVAGDANPVEASVKMQGCPRSQSY